MKKNILLIILALCLLSANSYSQEPILTVNAGHDVLLWVITPDQSQFLTAGKDKTVKLWDVDQKRLIYTFPAFEDPITALCISPSGKFLFVGATSDRSKKDSSEVRVIDMATYETLLSLREHPKSMSLGEFKGYYPIKEIRISPDEKTFTCIYDWGYVGVYEIATGIKLFSKDFPQNVWAKDLHIDYSRDSKRLLVLATEKMRGYSEMVKESNKIEYLGVFDIDMRKNIFSGSTKTFNNIKCASFSENSNVLLLGKENGAISAYDYLLKKTIWEYDQNFTTPKKILLSPDNKYLVLVVMDTNGIPSVKTIDYIRRSVLYDTKIFNKSNVYTSVYKQFRYFIEDDFLYFTSPIAPKLELLDESETLPWLFRKYELDSGKELPVPSIYISQNMLFSEDLFVTPDNLAMGSSSTYVEMWKKKEILNFWSVKNGLQLKVSNFNQDFLEKMKRDRYFKSILLDFYDHEDKKFSADKKLYMDDEEVEYTEKLKFTIRKINPDDEIQVKPFSNENPSDKIRTGTIIASKELGKTRFICFSPDNSYVFFSEGNGAKDQVKLNDNLLIFSTKGFEKIADIEGALDAGYDCLRFSSDNKYLAFNSRNNLFDDYHMLGIIDLETKEIKFKSEEYGNIKRFGAFSPDGKYLVSEYRHPDFRSSKKNQFNLIDLSNGKFTTYTMPSDILNVTFDSSSAKLFILTLDGRIIVWDIAQRKEIISMLRMKNNIDFVVITPDGRFDGTDEGIKNCLHYVSGKTIIPLESFYDQFYTPNLWAMALGNEQMPDFLPDIKTIKLPPLVEITSPKKYSKISGKQLIVEVTVTDQGGGIDEVLLYHNGKLVETSNRGFKQLEQKDTQSTKTFSVTLIDGLNAIKATAFNMQRIEAIADAINIDFKVKETVKPNLFLLVIGINEYKNSKYDLNYAVADATSFKDILQESNSNIFGSINTVFIKDTEAVKARIIEELDKIKMLAQQQDMFVFYFAGHGAMSEEVKSLFYLIPTDVTQMFSSKLLQEKAISAAELKQFSTEIKAQKQMFILDACQSGGMEEVLAARGAAEEKAIAQLARSTGTYWLAAANSQQFAGEFAQLKHGLFTYCILEAIAGKADGQNDKKITVQELSSYLNDQVPIISQKYKGSEQYPVTYGFGQDFPIAVCK